MNVRLFDTVRNAASIFRGSAAAVSSAPASRIAAKCQAVKTARARLPAQVRQMSTSNEDRQGPLQRAAAVASSLAQKSCEPCRKDSPKLSEEEYLAKLSAPVGDVGEQSLRSQGWTIIEAQPGENALSKRYQFRNFRTALAFTNVVGRIAEEQKHHPRLITEWGAVTVDWWTHAIGGLHDNDFVMAAKTEALAKVADGRKS